MTILKMKDKDCLQCITRVVWIGIWASILLAILQGTVGFVTGSKACLAIAVQSLCDLISSGAILITERISSKPANHEFPYGYGKAEFIAVGFTCLLFGAVAVSLGVTAFNELLTPTTVSFDFSPILVAIVSIIVNELLFRHMNCVGLRAKSQNILANAWANRAGSYAAGIVGVSSLGAWLGVPKLDAIATLIVALLIVKSLYGFFWGAIMGLMDKSVNDQYGDRIESIAKSVVGVLSINKIKSKHLGRKLFVEMSIGIDSASTIDDGQRISTMVKDILLAKIDNLGQVVVHFSPLKASVLPGAAYES